jgi:type I site-specific restriction endonuclease
LGHDKSWEIIPWQNGLDVSKLTCHAVTKFPTDNGPADYALFVNGVLLGIIEAKKITVNPQNVLEQAKRYSKGAANGPGNWNGFRVPFLYATVRDFVATRYRSASAACGLNSGAMPHQLNQSLHFIFDSGVFDFAAIIGS